MNPTPHVVEEPNWKKYPIGKFQGYSVYIELPTSLSGGDTNGMWNKAANYFEQSFRNHDFLEEMRNFLSQDLSNS